MKLSNLPNLRTEDFPSEQAWISKLFVVLNPFFQSLNQVLLQNVDYSDQIKSVTKSYDILTFQEFSFQWPYKDVAPVDLRVVKALQGSEQTPTILLAAWSYDATAQAINVSRMVEVTSTPGISELSGRYRFTLRASV